MENISNYNTPGESENTRQILESYDNELNVCGKQVDEVLKNFKKKGKKEIKDAVNLVMASRQFQLEEGSLEGPALRLSDDHLIKLSNELVERRVLILINDISKNVSQNFEAIINKFTFRESAGDLIKNMEDFLLLAISSESEATNILIKNTSKIEEAIKSNEKNENLRIQIASELMNAFHSMVSFPYLKVIFKLYGLEEYLDYFQELVDKVYLMIYAKFQSAQSKLFASLNQFLKTLKESFLPTIQKILAEQAKKLQNMSFEEAIVLHQKNKKDICNQFENNVKESYKFSLYPPLLDPILEEIIEEINEKFKDQLVLKKQQGQAMRKQSFAEVMERIQVYLFQKKQFFFLREEQMDDLVCFLAYHMPKNQPEQVKKLFTELFQYIFQFTPDSFTSEKKMLFIETLMNSKEYDLIEQDLKEKSKQIISLLEGYNGDMAELLLTEIYLAITNVRIQIDQKKVTVGPLYGILFYMRCAIIESIENSHVLKNRGMCSFFSFLDHYFEKKLIFNLGQYKENIFEKEGFQVILQEDQQDYGILATLRKTISQQNQQHPEDIKKEFLEVVLQIKEKTKLEMPDEFVLKKVSDSHIQSRNIVIAVSGFTSKEEDKQIKWAEVAKQLPNCEVYALQYDSKTRFELEKFIQEQVASFFVPSVGSLAGGIFGKIAKVLSTSAQSASIASLNPYQQAHYQACLSGKYLAQLLFEGNLFPNCSISFIGFSLGTQVICQCLQEYQKMIMASNKLSIVSSVLIIGGVADITDIRTSNLVDIIQYKLFNCYSKKDSILRYVLRIVDFFSDPSGLNSITKLVPNQQKKVENLDLTQKISAHLQHMKQIGYILSQVNFPSKY